MSEWKKIVEKKDGKKKEWKKGMNEEGTKH